jgi:GTP cyclohydrolase I
MDDFELDDYAAITHLIGFLGEDIDREGLTDTPERVLKAWKFFTKGYDEDPNDILKVFKEDGENYDEMVFQGSIPVFSTCIHHLLPFFGVAHVAYIPRPDGGICGLSKLGRVVDVFARRLQVQEKLTHQVADCLNEILDPLGVGVILKCRHMCMESRGIEKIGTVTITSSMRGAIKDEPEARSEFLSFVHESQQRTII